jgi:hypothetical protein
VPQTTRAKFRCNRITLNANSAPNPKVKAALGTVESSSQFAAKAREMGEPEYVTIGLPSVRLNPVYAGQNASEEDKAFWDATPNGSIELTITNPAAAETFELGETYYVDFSRAD